MDKVIERKIWQGKTGTEGNKNDPTHYEEYVMFTKWSNGLEKTVVVHMGLAEWMTVNGRKYTPVNFRKPAKVDWDVDEDRMVSYYTSDDINEARDAYYEFVKQAIGMRWHTFEKAIQNVWQ